MGKDEHLNSKFNILMVDDVLRENTNKSNPMLREKILDKIEEKYSVRLNPKTVTAMIDTLNEYYELYHPNSKGIKYIEHINKKGYYSTRKLLTASQAQFLYDAIYSSKSIGYNDSVRLTNFLKQYIPQSILSLLPDVYKHTYSKQDNNLFKNINTINLAIDKGKKITYKKLSFDQKGNPIAPNDNDIKIKVSPYLIVNSDSKYYMICSDEYHKTGSPRRLDVITDFHILDENIDQELKMKIIGDNPKKFMESRPYMYISEKILAEIVLENEYRIRDVKDNFENPFFSHKEDGIHVTFETDTNALYYWLLQYTNEIKIIKPVSLRNKIAMTLQRSLNTYKKMEITSIADINLNIQELVQNYFYTFRKQKDLNKYNKDLIKNELINYFKDFSNIYTNIEVKESNDTLINISVKYNDLKLNYLVILDIYTDPICDEIAKEITNKIHTSKDFDKTEIYYLGVQLDKDSTYAYHPDYKHLEDYLSEDNISMKWVKIADVNEPPKWLDYFLLKLK